MTSSESYATWNGILTIIVFFIANTIVIFPFRIPVSLPILIPLKVIKYLQLKAISYRLIIPSTISPPRTDHDTTSSMAHRHRADTGGFYTMYWIRTKIPFNFKTAPILSVIFLLITQAIDASVIRQGIVGENGVQPLDILALFISLAYLSVSLDNTGFFRYLAFSVTRKSGSSGKKLYTFLYFFFVASGVIVGNDPVVLTGTAFLAYLTRFSGITPPTAWIFAEFAAANIASAVLPPSNPTNLVVTGAFNISFPTYAAHTILPALAAALFVYIYLRIKYRSSDLIPDDIDLHELGGANTSSTSQTGGEQIHQTHVSDANSERSTLIRGVLVDRNGAIVGTVLLSITLIVLVGTSPLRVPVWEITVLPALIMLARDIWHDRIRWKLLFKDGIGAITRNSDSIILAQEDSIISNAQITIPQYIHSIRHDFFPTISNVLKNLPISLIPFALCMFILVQGLVSKGWVNVFASWWDVWVRLCAENGEKSEVVGGVTLMMILTALLCNICGTNIGATILVARLLQIWIQDVTDKGNVVNPRLKIGCMYAVALGSNIGAVSFSFSASLAGLLWRSILRQKGIHISQRQFATQNSPVLLIAICAAAGVLVAEVFITSA